ncbi:MAG: hypothetical protein MI739_04135, partial [Bacteroidales bacterium]|nr:hypothetical protein [Bacteroidales bacterium]
MINKLFHVRNLLIVVFMLFAQMANSQNLIDSSFTENSKTGFTHKIINKYDGNNNLIALMQYVYNLDNNTWEQCFLTQIIYNSDNKIKTELLYDIASQLRQKIEFEYTDEGYVYYNYTLDENNIWQKCKMVCVNTTFGDPLLERFFFLDDNTKKWKLHYKTNYKYNSNNKIIEKVRITFREEGNYRYREIFEYNNAGENNLIIGEYKDREGDIWIKSSKTENIYINGQLSCRICYSWIKEKEIWTKRSETINFLRNLKQEIFLVCPSYFVIKVNQKIKLPILEKPIAQNRIWKYKLKSEDVYRTFPINETEAVLNFSSDKIGLYDIICESTINGKIHRSNVVSVSVVGFEINPKKQSVWINEKAKAFCVTESFESRDRDWGYIKENGEYIDARSYKLDYIPQIKIPGKYYIVCKSEVTRYRDINSNKVEFELKGVGIQPSETQFVNPNIAGKTLSVVELPKSIKREWKYRCNNSDWESFSAKQTGASFTPNFSNVGHYQVACFSEFGDRILKSNEVDIRVISVANIQPVASQNITIGNAGNKLIAKSFPEADSWDWGYFISGYFKKLKSGKEFIPDFKKSGVYYVVCKFKYGDDEIISNKVKITVKGNVEPETNTYALVNEPTIPFIVKGDAKVDSREWKYRKEKSDIWQSFTPILTEKKVKPIFAKTGTYYLSCFVDGVRTNEVKIVVINQPHITPNKQQEIYTNTLGNKLSIPDTYDARYYWYAFNEKTNITEEVKCFWYLDYTPYFEEAGTYYIFCCFKWGDNMLNSDSVKVVVKKDDIPDFSNRITSTEEQFIEGEGTELTVEETRIPEWRRWYYLDLDGNEERTSVTSETFRPSTYYLDDGVGAYYVYCKSLLKGNLIESNKVKISVIGNKISSTYRQYMPVNVGGRKLNIKEYPKASSREWKYRRSDSYVWDSFAKKETGESLIPRFNSEGLYYIVCFSEINGKIYKSKKASIHIIPSSISPGYNQSIDVNTKGTELKVDMSLGSLDEDWYASTKSGGNYDIYLGSGRTYTPYFKKPGVYYIVCRAERSEGFVYSNEIKVTVSGSFVTPIYTQLTQLNTSGTELRVAEPSEVYKRQWKYYEKGKDRWRNIESATGKTYVPNFTKEGRYYIACFSRKNSKTFVSNKVEVIVNDTKISPKENQTIRIYENGNTISVTESVVADSRSWYYSTQSGKYDKFLATGNTVIPRFETFGEYYLVCKSVYGTVEHISDEIKITVMGNSINSGEQYVPLKTNGKELRVSEFPEADSREWKYKSSENGEWKSFPTKQTKQLYIPYFDIVGKYYVACFSVINGNEIKTNDVCINVVTSTITQNQEQTIAVNTDGTKLTVSETVNSDFKNWYYTTKPGGSLQYLTDSKTYTPNFSQAGVYYVVCKSEWDGISIRSNEVKITVFGNSISPTQDQIVEVDKNGKVITVTELPQADSREWKYKIIGTDNWKSFSTKQKEKSYTPNFSTAGEYAVSCFSSINGEIVKSNEAKILVVDNEI